MNIEEQVNADIKKAMLAKDKVSLEALRGIKKQIIEAKTAKGGSGEVDDNSVIKIIQKLAKQGKDSAGIYKEQNREDLYDQEMAQVKVFEKYLPEQLSDEDLTEIIKNIISETGAESMKEMGKVMGIASKKLAGKADGRAISEKVKALLSGM
jgi:uncharacterized protein YqeY